MKNTDIYDTIILESCKGNLQVNSIHQIIHAFFGGSHLHGARLEGKSDHDICGIFIEKPECILGLNKVPSIIYQTSGDGVKNTANDLDFTFKSLREWVRLACKGNPSVLEYAATFSEIEDPKFKNSVWFTDILPNLDMFKAKNHISAFLGYSKDQYNRMIGVRGNGKHGVRTELVDESDYDTKAAMHMIRLMQEGIEYGSTGKITCPRPEKDLLLAIRNGNFTFADICELFKILETRLLVLKLDNCLPNDIDDEKVNKLLSDIYLKVWRDEQVII
jgi:predicted nucleotidyltransferase